MSVVDKLLKRSFYPVQVGGEEVHVRSLTIRELKALDTLNYDDRTGFVLGCALLEPDGKPAFTRQSDEPDDTFSKRVIEGLLDIPSDNLAKLSQAIQRLGKPVDEEKLLKN